MPAHHPPTGRFLANHLARTRQLAVVGATQTTDYIVDPMSDTCETIVGQLEFDHHGNPTGLGNTWGIASFQTGVWTRVA